MKLNGLFIDQGINQAVVNVIDICGLFLHFCQFKFESINLMLLCVTKSNISTFF